jgi:hypothetical protein
MTATNSHEDVDMIGVDDDAFFFGGDVGPVDSFAVDSGADEQPGGNSDDGASVESGVEERYDSSDSNDNNDSNDSNDSNNEDDDLAGLDTTFTSRFRRIMERDMDLEGITDSAHEDLDGIDLDSASPFNNLQSMVLLAFIFGGDDMGSRRMMQKVLYLIVLILKIADKYRDSDAVFRLPTLDGLYNFETRKKNQVPTLTTTEVILAGSIPRTFFMNLPSTYLKQLVANPVRCRQISALPDYTPNQVWSLQQGPKWKTHPLFQQPVMTVNGLDYWVGDIIWASLGENSCFYLLASFFSRSGEVFRRCYKTFLHHDHGAVRCSVESVSSDFLISSFQYIIPKDGLCQGPVLGETLVWETPRKNQEGQLSLLMRTKRKQSKRTFYSEGRERA